MQRTLSTSWELVKASARILNEDRALLLFPLLSGAAFLALFATVIAPIFFMGDAGAFFDDWGPMAWGFLFLFYIAQYFVAFYFNAALVAAALIHLDGGRPTLSDGLRIASDHAMPLLGYAAISATVGIFLNRSGRRGAVGGRIVSGILGTAWNLATFLVVPVLVTRDLGPIDALKESARLLRNTWGHQITGVFGMGIAFGAMTVVMMIASGGLVFLASGLGPFGVVPVIGLLVVVWVLFALATTALQGIYRAAVYRYALTGDAGAGFERVEMEDVVYR